MSNIKEKRFDPALKIARTEFKGYPNLITSSDLNRQVEALDWRANQIEALVGLETDIKPSIMSLTNGTLKANFIYSELYVSGAAFTILSTKEFSISGVPAATATQNVRVYVHLTAKKKTSTFADGIMQISGAEFDDGTKLEAANQIIYYDEDLVLSLSTIGVTNSIGILGAFFINYGQPLQFATNSTEGSVPIAISQKELKVAMDREIQNTEDLIKERTFLSNFHASLLMYEGAELPLDLNFRVEMTQDWENISTPPSLIRSKSYGGVMSTMFRTTGSSSVIMDSVSSLELGRDVRFQVTLWSPGGFFPNGAKYNFSAMGTLFGTGGSSEQKDATTQEITISNTYTSEISVAFTMLGEHITEESRRGRNQISISCFISKRA